MDTSLPSNKTADATMTGKPSPAQNPPPEKDEDIVNYILNLPKQPGWRVSTNLCKYQNFWCFSDVVKGVILFQKNFVPQPNDILLCSFPKSGTTWLKSLSVAISTRTQFSSSNSLLTTKMPHDIVPVQEFLYALGHERDIKIPLVATHVPFDSLPKSILNSNTKIIYVCRNPKDVLVSLWHFSRTKEIDVIPFEDAFEKFCNGILTCGPYWSHVLGYWKASLKFPDRVLFLKYEDMKNDGCFYVKKMADFMGCPFSVDEEKQGVVEKIAEFCSFENLSNLEVNKSDNIHEHFSIKIENKLFFRKGEVGDWKNYLTAEMEKRLDQIIIDKFNGSGLHF